MVFVKVDFKRLTQLLVDRCPFLVHGVGNSMRSVDVAGNHQHEECLGGTAKRDQVYTRQLAQSGIDGLIKALIEEMKGGFSTRTVIVSSGHVVQSMGITLQWTLTVGILFGRPPSMINSKTMRRLYLGINRDEEAWRPLLAQFRLERKTSTSICAPPTIYISDSAPWNGLLCSHSRSCPMEYTSSTDCEPQNPPSQKPVTHRAAILRYNDGQINMESEGRFETPVAYGVYFVS